MSEQPLISVYTQVYNIKENDLRQCIESVLEQTYTNFEYIILDNGSTNGNASILQEYAKQDKRIKLTRLEPNVRAWRLDEVAGHLSGVYFTNLDADDWWESTYLESLLTFAQKYDLDIAATGSVFHFLANGTEGARALTQDLILDHAQFASAYSRYHAFFRVIWGKLIRMKIIEDFRNWPELNYGLDTVISFYYLRFATRMGIQGSKLHHYRVYEASVSYQYDKARFAADVYLYNDAQKFLRSYGPISKQNQIFLYVVYSNAILDTMSAIHNSRLTSDEKIHEYSQIATHQITQMTFRCQEEVCKKSKQMLLNLVCTEGLKLKYDNEDLQRAIQTLLPKCGLAVTKTNLPLFLTKELKTQFLEDDRDAVVKTLLRILQKIHNPQMLELGITMQRLALGHKLLFQVNDLEFLLQYTNIYKLIWEEKNIQALDQMTGLLLEHNVKKGQETFLNLYINLAAQLGQESAFIFGKIQLANFYYQVLRLEEARMVLKELEELGLGGLEEIQVLQAAILPS